MLEDPARDEPAGEGSDAAAASAAPGAAQHLDREGPLEEPTGSVGVQGDRRGGRRLAQGRVAEAADGIDRHRALCAIVATTPYARWSAERHEELSSIRRWLCGGVAP